MILLVTAVGFLVAAILLWPNLGSRLLGGLRALVALTPSTKRALRTVFQLTLALVTGMPALVLWLHGTPVEAQVTIFAGWVAIVAKVVNALEDAGVIPAWLKG